MATRLADIFIYQLHYIKTFLMSFESIQATASRILNDLEGDNDDTRLNYIMIRDKVLVARASVIMKMYAKYPGNLPGQLYNECCFTVNCEPVCEGAPVNVIRGMLPSSVLASLGKRAINYLGSADYMKAFEQRDTHNTNLKSYIPFGTVKEEPYFVMTGQQVTVYNLPTENMTNFLIRAIFSNPNACKCPDEKIFVPVDMIDQIEQQVKYDLASFLLQRKQDQMSNANADT
jgi:hypothetical protein